MACEARIVRVLRTLEYPGTVDVDVAAAPSFLRKPAEIARMVAWIEDRKVMTLTVAASATATRTTVYCVCNQLLPMSGVVYIRCIVASKQEGFDGGKAQPECCLSEYGIHSGGGACAALLIAYNVLAALSVSTEDMTRQTVTRQSYY